MDLIKKLASRKLGAAIGGGVALSAASPEALWPTAFMAAAHIPSGKQSSILGASEARQRVKKTGEQPFTALPQFCFYAVISG